MRRWTMLLLATLLVAACGSNEPEATSTTSTSLGTTTTTTNVVESTSTSMAETTTTESTTSTAASEVDIEITGGEVVGTETFVVELGETVDITVVSDVDEELHVHGYDLSYQLEAGVPQQITFVADIPGVFEVESHSNHTLVFELEVGG